ncbi:hypothetical protein GmHk_02G004395 [Glycine max]|nr:hypothetical protein GmHk_02G004395 [Glycine max]
MSSTSSKHLLYVSPSPNVINGSSNNSSSDSSGTGNPQPPPHPPPSSSSSVQKQREISYFTSKRMGCLFGSGGFRWRVVKEEVTMQGSLGLVVAAEGGYDGGVVMRRMEMMHVVIVSENHNASDLEGIRRCHNTNRKRNNQIGVFGKAGGWWLSVSRSRSTLKSKGRLCCQRRKCRKEKEKEKVMT